MDIQQQVRNFIAKCPSRTLLVHSDVMRGFQIPFKSRAQVMSDHVDVLSNLKDGGVDVWMPAFNYDFCKGQEFDVANTPSQVGSLTEFFRKERAAWRSTTPVFSFSGTGPQPVIDLNSEIDPFGSASTFDFLYKADAVMMHYGSMMMHSTILHYAERLSGKLNYRYDKIFLGTVREKNGHVSKVRFNFHVRPMGKHLDYNWPVIESDLVQKGIVAVFEEDRARTLCMKVRDLVDYWIERMRADPLYLLDPESRGWIEPMLNKLGRPLLLTDFEKGA